VGVQARACWEAGAWSSRRREQRASGTWTTPTRSANIDWMHRHRPTHHGTQPKAFLMNAPRQARVHWNRGFDPGTRPRHRNLLQGKLQYSNYWGGAVFAPFAVRIGVLGILAGIVTWRKQRLTNFVLRLCCRRTHVIYDSVLSGW
jgi:hypothetical protein